MREPTRKRTPRWIYPSPLSPYWQYDFTIRGDRYHGSTELTDETEALAYARNLREEKRRWHRDMAEKSGQAGKLRDVSWLDALNAYCEDVLYENWDVQSVGPSETRYDWLSNWIGDRRSMLTIDDDLIKRLVKDLRKRHAYDNPAKNTLAPRSINTYIAQVKAVVDYTRDDMKIPLPDAPNWARHLEETEQRTRVISAEELVKFEELADEDLWNCIEFSLESAIRKKTAAELTWKQVDPEAGIIRIINKGKKPRKRKGDDRVKRLTSVGKIVEINITKRIAEILTAQWGKHTESVFTYVALRNSTDPKTGARIAKGQVCPMTTTNYSRQYRRLCEKIGIDDLTIHDLRRSKGSFVYRRTGSLGLAQNVLKHSNYQTTEKAYAFMTTVETGLAMEAATELSDNMRARYQARTGRAVGRKRPGNSPEFASTKQISADDKGTYADLSSYPSSRNTTDSDPNVLTIDLQANHLQSLPLFDDIDAAVSFLPVLGQVTEQHAGSWSETLTPEISPKKLNGPTVLVRAAWGWPAAMTSRLEKLRHVVPSSICFTISVDRSENIRCQYYVSLRKRLQISGVDLRILENVTFEEEKIDAMFFGRHEVRLIERGMCILEEMQSADLQRLPPIHLFSERFYLFLPSFDMRRIINDPKYFEYFLK